MGTFVGARPWRTGMPWNIWKSWSECLHICSAECEHKLSAFDCSSFTSKYITIIYSVCGIIFISLPFAFYIFDLPREDWMLPLTLRIFFTNNKAHPGYALNFLVSAYAVNNLCLMLAGKFGIRTHCQFLITDFNHPFQPPIWHSCICVSTYSFNWPFARPTVMISVKHRAEHPRDSSMTICANASSSSRKYACKSLPDAYVWCTSLFPFEFADSWRIWRAFLSGKYSCNASLRFW